MKFAMSYSFGKDSSLSLWRMLSEGHEPVCLIVTINQEAERSWSHGVDLQLMDEVSRCLSIPLIKCFCTGENYGHEFEKSLAGAKNQGAQACVFGDIDIVEHLTWNQERCNAADLDCIVPLWKADRQAVVREVVDEGFRAIIKCVDSRCLDDSFLGLTIDHDVLARLEEAGVDVCGENGEYHTFVNDGPIFKTPVAVSFGKIIDFGTHSALDIVL